ncbi:MAG TPA: ATP-binding cassette domain-containing protein [Xanthobacteraceae bacterium]|nr:ATP-binding cassette domain-containing protein [Xanthobacteraceae bacterium]
MPFLRARNLSVEFSIYQGSSRSLKKMVFATAMQGNLGRDSADRINVRALNDVSLDIENGDRVGLIGANGAGKTTLLRVLAGIYFPTRGKLYSSGKISALLDASVGLNAEATGRENIILRGMYMDIHPREMRARVDKIVEFTELGPYIDMPARTYSSGMMVRLGFAISTCMPAEILIMDEWLSAGDIRFLEKAQRRMEQFVGGSSILVLASHSPELLRKWCNRGIMLQNGRIAAHGSIDEVIKAYVGTPPREIAPGGHAEIAPLLDIVSDDSDGLARPLETVVRERDLAVGLTNLQADRLARHVHRHDMAVRRAAASARSSLSASAAGTRDRIVLFLFLLKAGGETLMDVFIRNLETKDFLVIDNDDVHTSALGTWSPVAIDKALGRLQKSQIDDLRFVWGPYRHGIDARLPKPCAGVTLLHDPLERAISHYLWADQSQDPMSSLKRHLSSSDSHCPLLLDNYMTRILSGVAELDPEPGATTARHSRVSDADFELAASNLDGYMVVGLTDQFDQTLLVMGRDLGWSLSDLLYKPPAKPALPTASISASSRDRLMDWNRYDAALIERARAHLTRRLHEDPYFEKELALFRKLNALFQQGTPVEDLRRLEYATVAR